MKRGKKWGSELCEEKDEEREEENVLGGEVKTKTAEGKVKGSKEGKWDGKGKKGRREKKRKEGRQITCRLPSPRCFVATDCWLY